MSATEQLDRLAAQAGIEDGWWDFFGQWRAVGRDTKRAFLAAMGFAVESDASVAAALAAFEAAPWRRWLDPVTVHHDPARSPSVTLTLPAARDAGTVAWTLVPEDGGALPLRGRVRPWDLPFEAEAWLDGVQHLRRRLTLPAALAAGIHTLRLTTDDGCTAETTLIVAPDRAFLPPPVAHGRVWGVATQLYSLRGAADWGCGSYGDLGALAAQMGRAGASCVGVNPLHALFPSQPDRFSPYAPSSRTFLNTAYLDVEAVPDFAESAEARALATARAPAIAALRALALIDYAAVDALKRPVLDACYRHFRDNHLIPASARGRAFRAFQHDGGPTAALFATFEALQAHVLAADPARGYWRHWPPELRDPANPAVAHFAAAHRAEVDFYWYLQWLADGQLGAAQDAALGAGMSVGLYRDLGVGIAEDGAEAWAQQALLAQGVSVGAPPDPLNHKGQDWGLAPYSPLGLRDAAYRPFLAVLDANMRHAGALRLDHAMSLQRLYWVPRGAAADEGAYVRYPVADLFGVVALASHRRRCLVIGEDMGTVPAGFRERMAETDILGYRLMVFEKTGPAAFKPPAAVTAEALVSVATHDLPSLQGWWRGIDLESREILDLYPRPGMDEDERRARDDERAGLVAAFQAEGLLAADFPTTPDLSPAQAAALSQAAHAFVDRTPARLMMVQLEDVLDLVLQMNLPGTTTQHPNWRVRLPQDIATIAHDPRLLALAARLRESRGVGMAVSTE